MNIYDMLKNFIPNTDPTQYSSVRLMERLVSEGIRPSSILDFGCGTGETLPLFKKLLPASTWWGLDVEDSPEVRQRTLTSDNFITYDGKKFPFPDNHFDMVYSHQVLEHVSAPLESLCEIARVLKSDGIFVGQTSQFEPYHSFSFYNFTVFGFTQLCQAAGLNVIELRPGIDGFTLMERSYLGRPPEMSKFFKEESPRNREIADNAVGRPARIINFRKLMYAGQFIFLCVKNDICMPKPSMRVETFSSPDYWEKRYKTGGNSGSGSYGRLASFKSNVINSFIALKKIKDAIEFGFGDGNQLSLLSIEQYLGFEISQVILEKTKMMFSHDSSKKFLHVSQFKSQQAQLVLSLDVIFHLVEDDIFYNYMNMIFSASTKYVIIYSSNKESEANWHVRHRKFTDTIDHMFPNWRCIETIVNPYQYDISRPTDTSFCDFYIFEKTS